jgi:hypothetical protein
MKLLLTPMALLLLAAAPRRPDVFTIPIAGRDELRFIVTGDAGTGDAHLHDGIAALAKKMRIDGILLVGDNVYPCGVTSVGDPQWSKVTRNFADAGLKVYPILGNHDYGDPTYIGRELRTCGSPSPLAQIAETHTLPFWVFPARQYELTAPFVTIAMMDSQPVASAFAQPYAGSQTAAAEVAWVDEAFRGAKGWRIVAGHHTIYSSGIHGVRNGRDQRHMREHAAAAPPRPGRPLHLRPRPRRGAHRRPAQASRLPRLRQRRALRRDAAADGGRRAEVDLPQAVSAEAAGGLRPAGDHAAAAVHHVL